MANGVPGSIRCGYKKERAARADIFGAQDASGWNWAGRRRGNARAKAPAGRARTRGALEVRRRASLDTRVQCQGERTARLGWVLFLAVAVDAVLALVWRATRIRPPVRERVWRCRGPLCRSCEQGSIAASKYELRMNNSGRDRRTGRLGSVDAGRASRGAEFDRKNRIDSFRRRAYCLLGDRTRREGMRQNLGHVRPPGRPGKRSDPEFAAAPLESGHRARRSNGRRICLRRAFDRHLLPSVVSRAPARPRPSGFLRRAGSR